MRPTHVHNFGTFFVTTATWERRRLFQIERYANLLIKTVYWYRDEGKYLLHEFVIMPDHLHLILTPIEISLERAIQLVKGGFSYRASRELESKLEIWQKGFTDHRIRDAEDYIRERDYLVRNPMRAGLCSKIEDYPYSSAHVGFDRDDVPQRLKPVAESA